MSTLKLRVHAGTLRAKERDDLEVEYKAPDNENFELPAAKSVELARANIARLKAQKELPKPPAAPLVRDPPQPEVSLLDLTQQLNTVPPENGTGANHALSGNPKRQH